MPACVEAFSTQKQRLTSAPILAHLDYNLLFIRDADASDTGLGAVLSHVHSNGKEHVIAYVSRTLTKIECCYCVIHKELLAVVTFVKHF